MGGRRGHLALILLLVALSVVRGTAAGSASVANAGIPGHFAVDVATLPPPPLFLAIAHVVMAPGAVVEGGGTVGPRLLLVEAGALTVAPAGNGSGLAADGASNPGARETVVAAGDRLGLATGRIGGLRNDAARPVVYLDAAIMPAADQPATGAFTTDEGVSFQLLAAALLDEAPRGPVRVRLWRLDLTPGQGLPSGPWPGPTLLRVESGSLRLTAATAGLHYSRAAAAAPYSAAGPMRPVAPGLPLTLAAGASLVVPAGATAAAANERATPARLLMLEVVPVVAASAGPAAGPVR